MMSKMAADEATIIEDLKEARRRVSEAEAATRSTRADLRVACLVAHNNGLSWARIGRAINVHFTRARELALKAEDAAA